MKKTAKIDWVFWLTIRFRPNWFKLFWSTRGSNYMEFQILIFVVSIGMPWLNSTMIYPNYLDENINTINKNNLQSKFSFLIKR